MQVSKPSACTLQYTDYLGIRVYLNTENSYRTNNIQIGNYYSKSNSFTSGYIEFYLTYIIVKDIEDLAKRITISIV